MSELLKGFTCECGIYHEFTMYYFAHYDEVMILTCSNCEQNIIYSKGKQ